MSNNIVRGIIRYERKHGEMGRKYCDKMKWYFLMEFYVR